MVTSLTSILFVVIVCGIIFDICTGVEEARSITKIDNARKARASSNMLLDTFLGGILILIGKALSKHFHLLGAIALLLGVIFFVHNLFHNMLIILKLAELQDKN